MLFVALIGCEIQVFKALPNTGELWMSAAARLMALGTVMVRNVAICTFLGVGVKL